MNADHVLNPGPFPGDELVVEIDPPDVSQMGFRLLTLEDQCRYTPREDLHVLFWLIKQIKPLYHDILEIGCNEGYTTMQLAFNFPKFIVYGVDYSGPDATMCPGQMKEFISADKIGHLAEGFTNVWIHREKFSEDASVLDIARAEFAFVDGDHTYEGVKRDTEALLTHFAMCNRRLFVSKDPGMDRIIAWHDYAKSDDHHFPDWLQVGQYLRAEIAPKFQLTYVRGTNVAFIRVPENYGL